MLPLPSSSSAPRFPTYSSPRHRRGYAGPRKLQVGGGRESHRQFRWAFPGKVTLWGALIEAVARREKRHRKRSPYPPPRTAFRMRGGFRMVRRSSQGLVHQVDPNANKGHCCHPEAFRFKPKEICRSLWSAILSHKLDHGLGLFGRGRYLALDGRRLEAVCQDGFALASCVNPFRQNSSSILSVSTHSGLA